MYAWTGPDLGAAARGAPSIRRPDPPPVIVVPTAEGQWWCSLCGHYRPVTHDGICVDASACIASWTLDRDPTTEHGPTAVTDTTGD